MLNLALEHAACRMNLSGLLAMNDRSNEAKKRRKRISDPGEATFERRLPPTGIDERRGGFRLSEHESLRPGYLFM